MTCSKGSVVVVTEAFDRLFDDSAGAVQGALQLHLLVSSLHAAVALVQVRHVAVRIRDDLHLDVPRPLNIALDQHAVVAECSRRLALRRFKRRLPTTRGKLQHVMRVADVQLTQSAAVSTGVGWTLAKWQSWVSKRVRPLYLPQGLL